MREGSVRDPTGVWTAFKNVRRGFFEYRYYAGIREKTALAIGFAALTGIAAQIRIPLPFSPVPITFQTFAVLLSGVALGGRWGGVSQTAYVGLGAVGVPWFSGFAAGLATLTGATGGYLIGFVAAAMFVGYLTDRYVSARRLPGLLTVLLVGNFVVIYVFGLPWLYAWMTIVQGASPTLLGLLTAGLFPFIVGDIVKVVGATVVANAITPLTAFGPEESGLPFEV